MTEDKKLEIRLECIKAAVQMASKVSLSRDACADVAEKMYEFVVGGTKKEKVSSLRPTGPTGSIGPS